MADTGKNEVWAYLMQKANLYRGKGMFSTEPVISAFNMN